MITRAQIRRQLRSQGGIMNAVPRQGYFLGGIGRSIGKAVGKVGDVVGQITKSDIGKAALLGAGVYYGGGGNLFGAQRAGMSGFKLGNLPGYLRAKNFMMGKPLGSKTARDAVARGPSFLSKFIPETTLGKVAAGGAALATGAMLMGPKGEDAKELAMLKERGGDVEGYLRQYYKSYYQSNWQEGWTQEEEDQFVTANTQEYNQGGRVGLYGGGSPDVMEETEMPPISDIIREEGINVGPQVKKLDAGAQSITKEGDHQLMASETSPMAELHQIYLNALDSGQIPKATTFEMFLEMVQQNQGSQQPGVMTAAKGGRVGLALGTDEVMEETEMPPISDIIREEGINVGPQVKDQMQDIEGQTAGISTDPNDPIYRGINPKVVLEFIQEGIPLGYRSPQEYFQDFYGEMNMAKGGRVKYGLGSFGKGRSKMVLKDFFNEDEEEYAQGGRIKKNLGGMGLMGLPGIPRMAEDGMEYDMRSNGGFQPLGAKEGKDDVKAMLAKNEFVMTADAVRAAGGGDVNKGAQRMYDTMKNLEGKIA